MTTSAAAMRQAGADFLAAINGAGRDALLYHPGDRFDEAASVQSEFFRSQLDA